MHSSRTATWDRRPLANLFAVNTLMVLPFLKYTTDSFWLSFILRISLRSAGDISISSLTIFSEIINLLCPRVAEPKTIREYGRVIALQQENRAIIKLFAAARDAIIAMS